MWVCGWIVVRGEVSGESRDIYLTLHCQHQNDSVLIKTGSGESHSNVSNVVKRNVTRLSLNHSYLKRTESRSVLEPTSV